MTSTEASKVKIYVAQRMTGRHCDEMLQEANMLVRTLSNYGFEPLSPVLVEAIPNEHTVLEQVNAGRLVYFWQRDKEMIRDADIVLDYMSCNMSDGVNKEVAYARYCLWKPVVRVWPNVKLNVSKLEDDVICDSLVEAISIIQSRWGDFGKLGDWRRDLLSRCFMPWLAEQHKINGRYGITSGMNQL